VAYAAADMSGGGSGSGCIMWTKPFVDLRFIDNGQDIYQRLAKSELKGNLHESVLFTSSILRCIAVLSFSFSFSPCSYELIGITLSEEKQYLKGN
jgi:hypothetical protein